MMLHYIAQLNKMVETQRAQPAQPSSLRDRVAAWYRSLPAVSRDRRFSMSEIEAALKTQGKYLSPVLLELGWRRKRVWSTTGQYHRYWDRRRVRVSFSAKRLQGQNRSAPSARLLSCRCDSARSQGPPRQPPVDTRNVSIMRMSLSRARSRKSAQDVHGSTEYNPAELSD